MDYSLDKDWWDWSEMFSLHLMFEREKKKGIVSDKCINPVRFMLDPDKYIKTASSSAIDNPFEVMLDLEKYTKKTSGSSVQPCASMLDEEFEENSTVDMLVATISNDHLEIDLDSFYKRKEEMEAADTLGHLLHSTIASPAGVASTASAPTANTFAGHSNTNTTVATTTPIGATPAPSAPTGVLTTPSPPTANTFAGHSSAHGPSGTKTANPASAPAAKKKKQNV